MATLELTRVAHDEILAHLLRDGHTREEAAFVFARPEAGDVFRGVEWMAIEEEGFAFHSSLGIELSDATRAHVIKRAHDLDASLVEFHSHPYDWPASFSPSDLLGFEEFVPHVWWRLKARPYLAVVVAPTGFDALAWTRDPRRPEQLSAIRVDGRDLEPTGLTLR